MYSINVIFLFVLCVQFWKVYLFIEVEQCQGPIHKSQLEFCYINMFLGIHFFLCFKNTLNIVRNICSIKLFDALKTVSIVFNLLCQSKLLICTLLCYKTSDRRVLCLFRNSDLKMLVICIWKNENSSWLLHRRKNEKFNSPCQEWSIPMTCQKKCKINIYY